MASGNDARLGLALETTYGTRVAPSRFIPFTGEDVGYARNRYNSRTLGVGRWATTSIITTASGSGSISGEVPTTGFGYLLNGLHSATVAPVQIGTTTAYTQTHSLATAPARSYSIQKQVPPVRSNTLIPIDYIGCRMGGITLSWDAGGVLTYSISLVVREEQTGLAAAAYVAPTAFGLFSFKGGALRLGGALVADLIGDGSLTIEYAMRDDAFALGTGGLMAEPVETDKPTATLSTTADFNDLTHLNRTINNTFTDAELTFEGETIAGSTSREMFRVAVPGMVSTSPSPTVDGPGPVSQAITLSNASSTGAAPVITYVSTDTIL